MTIARAHLVEWRLKDAAWVAKARQRLQSLSWFMKCLKEAPSRLANGEGWMPGDLTPTPCTNREALRSPSGDSPRRLQEQRPRVVGVSAKPEKFPHVPAIRDDWVVPG